MRTRFLHFMSIMVVLTGRDMGLVKIKQIDIYAY